MAEHKPKHTMPQKIHEGKNYCIGQYPSLIPINMLPLHDEVLDELPRACGPQDARIVFLLEDHGLVTDHDPVALSLLVHVGVVALPLNIEMQQAVAHLVHLDLLVRPVELQPVEGGTGLGSGHRVLEPFVDKLYVHGIAQ